MPMGSFAQTPPAIQWQHTYGGSYVDQGWHITATSDGGFIACANTSSNDGDVSGFIGGTDVWVIKLDTGGNMEWARCYGGYASELSRMSIMESPQGGFLLTSNTESTDGDVTCPYTGNRLWLARIDPEGELLWDLCPAGSAISGSGAIIPAHNGGWLVCGGSHSNEGMDCGHGQGDLWLGHISDAGDMNWSRCYGGSGPDIARSISRTSDGGYIVAGITRSNDGDLTGINPYWVPPSPSSTGWVLKVDGSGAVQWQHCYGGSWNEELYTAVEAVDASFWVLGNTRSNDGHVSGNHGEDDGWVLRLGVNGELLTQRCIGGTGSEGMSGLVLLPNGHALVGMNTNSSDGDITDPKGLHDGWVVELDPDLNIVWEHSYGGTNHEGWRSVEQSTDGSVVLLGYTYSTDGDLIDYPSGGSADVWIMKLAPWDHTAVQEEAHENGIHLFPNPTTGDLQLQLNGLDGPGWQLVIVDALGRMVHYAPNLNAAQRRHTLSTHGLAQGTYAVRLYRNGESHVRRFIKQ